jgi:tetratricopeptide (TPR) repeat protein
MRVSLLLLSLVLLATAAGQTLDQGGLDQFLLGKMNVEPQGKKGGLDPKRIINGSNSFLKEREPEMNAEEFALYERVVEMFETNAPLAVKLLEAMMGNKEPPSPAFEFILGNAYYNADLVEKAEASYRSAVKRYPEFVRAWNNLGVLCYTAGRYADAVPCFSKAVTLGDRDPMTFGLLGSCLEREEDDVAAELAFMQALGGDPGNTEWKEGLLRVSIRQKQFARAESLVKKLVKDHPQETRYWLVYANILLSENRKLDATLVLETAAGTGVADADQLALLGDLYADQDFAAEALRTYQRLLAMAPEMGERRLLTLAGLQTNAGKYREAKETLDRLEPKVAPARRVELLAARADWHVAQKQWPAARAQLEALLQLAPFNGRALLGLGRAFVAEGDPVHAQFAFEAAARVDEVKYAASLELANLELKNRHYGRSVDYLQQALRIERTDAVEDYLTRVKSLAADEPRSTP